MPNLKSNIQLALIILGAMLFTGIANFTIQTLEFQVQLRIYDHIETLIKR